MRVEMDVTLPSTGSWFAPYKDGSGVLRLEIPATEFPKVILLSKFMDCYVPGKRISKATSFKVIVTDEMVATIPLPAESIPDGLVEQPKRKRKRQI